MQVTFYGAAGGVTGSKFLVEVGDQKVLLDCGTFQGIADVRARNRFFPFAPDQIKAVVLSHAHLDHCGMLPLLVKRGFLGEIFATPATKQVAEYMLLDAAGIEEQDAAYRQKHKLGAKEDRQPLFETRDIPAVMKRFREVPYVWKKNAWHEVVPGVRVKLYDAGHILGSAVVVLELTEGQQKKHMMFSGDLGAPGRPLLRDPQVPDEPVQVALLESTYGDRTHEPYAQGLNRLADVIRKVAQRGGKIVVPAFSLGRTQMLVYELHKLRNEDKIPKIPVYVDSPLAIEITDVFRANAGDYDRQTQVDFGQAGKKPLAFEGLTYVKSIEESKQLNTKAGPFIVLSAAGMMTSGRVVHHLRHVLADERNAVLVTGYQAEGTVGRRILEGAKKVELYGDMVPVRAEIEVFNEFSAHADKNELIDYAQRLQEVESMYLVHGEPSGAEALKLELQQRHPEWKVKRPHEGDTEEI